MTHPWLARALAGAMVSAWLSACLSGCGERPARGFEDFYAALVDGDARVLDRLDAASRRQVEEAARARGVDPAQALAGEGVRSALRAIRERDRAGDRATLEVEDALGNIEVVSMTLEDGRWRVVLAAAPVEGAAAP